MLKIKEGYSVRGKITLPAMFKGQKVLGICGSDVSESNNQITHGTTENGFAGNAQLKMVFWERGATPVFIDSRAFALSGLIYFEFLPSIALMSSYSFYHLRSAANNAAGGLMNRDLSNLTSLMSFTTNIFNRAFGPTFFENTLKLPGGAKLDAFYDTSFAYNEEENIVKNIIIGAPDNSSKVNSIYTYAFYTNSNSPENGYNITIYADITKAPFNGSNEGWKHPDRNIVNIIEA